MNPNAQPSNPWANPTPAGLVALSVACFCFYALLSGKITSAALPLMGCWLLGGFVVQLIVGLLDLKSGNSTGGNTFLYFSAFFMLVGGMEVLIKFQMAIQDIPLDARVDGWAWLALTFITILWTPAFFKSTLLLTLIMVCLDISLPFIALIDIGILDKSFSNIPAWGLLMAGIIAIYLSSALVLNTAYGKSVLPIPGSIIK